MSVAVAPSRSWPERRKPTTCGTSIERGWPSIAAETDERFAHRREIDDGRDAGEILKEHPSGVKGDLDRRQRLGIPVEHRLDVLAADDATVLVAQEVLEQNLERAGQPLELRL